MLTIEDFTKKWNMTVNIVNILLLGKILRRAQDEYEKRLSAFILQECVIVNERPRIAGI